MKLSISTIAQQLNVAWNTANTAILDEGKRHLIDDPTRFDGVRVLGVDEHVWRHTRRGDKDVTVIIDLTAVHDGTGTARLLDMVEGRSKAVFKDWLQSRPQAWRDQIEVVAMDGFTGFKTATEEELNAVAVLDPFHVVRLGGDALTTTRQRVQQELHGHRGRKGEPLYMARQTVLTGEGLLTVNIRGCESRSWCGSEPVVIYVNGVGESHLWRVGEPPWLGSFRRVDWSRDERSMYPWYERLSRS